MGVFVVPTADAVMSGEVNCCNYSSSLHTSQLYNDDQPGIVLNPGLRGYVYVIREAVSVVRYFLTETNYMLL